MQTLFGDMLIPSAEAYPRRKRQAFKIANVDPTCKVAEVQLFYKSTVPPSEMASITCSRDASLVLRPFFEPFIEHREVFFVILMNRANKVLGVMKVSEGGIAGTVADPRIIMQAAILANASGIILAHNHPSGSLQPSQADIQLTKKIKEAGKVLDIQVLDHVILRSENWDYYSFADQGKL